MTCSWRHPRSGPWPRACQPPSRSPQGSFLTVRFARIRTASGIRYVPRLPAVGRRVAAPIGSGTGSTTNARRSSSSTSSVARTPTSKVAPEPPLRRTRCNPLVTMWLPRTCGGRSGRTPPPRRAGCPAAGQKADATQPASPDRRWRRPERGRSWRSRACVRAPTSVNRAQRQCDTQFSGGGGRGRECRGRCGDTSQACRNGASSAEARTYTAGRAASPVVSVL